MPKKKNIDWRVYALTDNLGYAQKLIAAGVGVIQYRNKNIPDNDFVNIAKQIKNLCDLNNICFIINDRYKLVKEIDCDGVHVGLQDENIKIVRNFLGPDYIIGASIKEIPQALQAQTMGADYISVSPVFDTINKPEEKGVGLERLKEVVATVSVPVVAIGSITEQNLPQIVLAGAKSAAFIGELANAADLLKKVKDLKDVFIKYNRQLLI